MQYAFILGKNLKLSIAEIMAVLPDAKIIQQGNSFLILKNEKINCQEVLNRMGGTIKIAEVLSDNIEKSLIVANLKSQPRDGKLKFGLSYYECKKDNLGMQIKTALKEAGISCRLVVSKDKALSSVVVQKNKVNEFLILGSSSPASSKEGKKWLAQTRAIQDFESYGKRDFARPARDMRSGSMPPKLAQIMINLAQAKPAEKIYDPFCGSGTMLQEAAVMGYKQIAGSDKSARAVADTQHNLHWLARHFNIPNIEVAQIDVLELASHTSGIDAIVTEPYLGPPLRGGESAQEIKANITALEALYLGAFEQFTKVLNPGGRVVIVLPTFRAGKDVLQLDILDQIKNLGFTQISTDDLIYSREGQKVFRNIRVFSLSSRT